jgi:hypothetical protein
MRPHLVIPFGLVGAAANHVVVVATGAPDDPDWIAPQRVFAWCVGFALGALLGRVVEAVGSRPAAAALGAIPVCVVAGVLDRFVAGFGPPEDVSATGAGLAAALLLGPVLAIVARAAREAQLARPSTEVAGALRRTKWVIASSVVLAAAAFGRAAPWQLLLVGMPVYLYLLALAFGTVPLVMELRGLARSPLSPVAPELLGESFAPRAAPRPRVVDAGVGEGARAVVLREGSAYRDPGVVSTVVRGDPAAALGTLWRSLAIQIAAAAFGTSVAFVTLVG